MSAFEGGIREYMEIKEAKLQEQRRAEVTMVCAFLTTACSHPIFIYVAQRERKRERERERDFKC